MSSYLKLLRSLFPLLFVMMLVGLFLTGHQAAAQNRRREVIDDLKAQLNTEDDSDVRIKLYLDIAPNFLAEPDSILHYTELARLLFRESADSSQHLYRYYNNLILAYTYTGDFRNGIDVSKKYEGILDEAYSLVLNDRDKALEIYGAVIPAFPYNAIGDLYRKMGDLEMALEHHLKALKVAEIMDSDHGALADSYNNVGIVYDLMGNYTASKDFYFKSLEINSSIDGREFNIASNYNNLGIIYKNLKKYDSAAYYYLNGIELMDRISSKYGKAVLLDNLGTLYTEEKKYEQAIATEYQALELQIATGSKEQQAKILMNIANNYFLLSDYEKAEELELEAYRISKLVESLDDARKASEMLYQLYEKTNNFEKSLYYLKEFKSISDSLVNEAKNETISKLQIRYETEQKEAENRQLHIVNGQQATLNRVLGGGGAALATLLAALGFLYLRQNKQKQIIEHQALELQKLSDMKSEFFANISHELRTPLTLERGNIENVILSGDRLSPDNARRLKNAIRSNQQLGRMIDDLLDLSRLELGQYQLKPTPVSLNKFVGRVVSSFQSLADDRGVGLGFSTALADDVAADLDTRQFEKVINNLFYNAFKFSPRGTSVSVGLSEQAGRAVISVRDEGAGIPEADLPRIFDRFYRVRNQEAEGSGLGLTIAREVTEQHGGRLTVESKKGQGTVFHVDLPVSEQQAALESDQTSDLSATAFLNNRLIQWEVDKPQVLIVEDNKDMQTYLEEILSEHFNTAVCENGQKALDWLQVQTPHLIISDVMMPEMDGFELLKRVKDDSKKRYLPFMLVTARGAAEDRYTALRLGVDDYIVKPFDRDELLVRVVNLIDNLQKRLKWAEENQREPSGDGEKITLTTEDEKLVRRLEKYVLDRIKENKIAVADLAAEAAHSERQLYRKLSIITGFTPNEFIMEVRLQHARSLLVSGQIAKISQLADEVGIATPDYLSRKFFERFGKRPTDYL